MNTGLDRFLLAQEEGYARALQELRSGRKQTHWMWFIFPQIHGLGQSFDAHYYAIQSRAEAEAYLAHPILGHRLEEISYALLLLECSNAQDSLGYTDSLKLRSCMTLFYTVSGNWLYKKVLDKFYGGETDILTLHILKKEEQ